jgi:maleylpyruvate isomerase
MALFPGDPVEGYLQQLRSATEDLVRAIAGLSDAAARSASPLPGWTRGHVLTHLARNAEGGARLLGWARTGVPSYEYESVEARAAAIEQGAGRPAAVLIADVQQSADEFFAATDGMSAAAWQRTVRWTTGHETEAALIVPSRLGEVLIHHVDLDIGYRPSDWPAAFVSDLLDRAVRGLRAREELVGPVRLEGTDTGRVFEAGKVTPVSPVVAGPEYALGAWLLGRSDGSDLSCEAHDGLPDVPPFYAV